MNIDGYISICAHHTYLFNSMFTVPWHRACAGCQGDSLPGDADRTANRE